MTGSHSSRDAVASGMSSDVSSITHIKPLLVDLTDAMGHKSMFAVQIEEDSWQLTYMDVITLLFATFVLLLALSGNQIAKQQEVLEGMHAQSLLPFWKTRHPSIAPSDEQTAPAPTEPERIASPEPVKLDPVIEPAPSPGEQAVAPAPTTPEQSAMDDISQRVIAQGLGDVVTVEHQKGGVIITMKETLLFPSGQAVLSLQGANWLRGIAPVIRSDHAFVSVEGHTDNVPIHTEAYPSNWELSAGRASSVVRELIAAGIPADKLRAVGYGDSRPIGYNAFPGGREQNRRVQIKLNFSGREGD